jgi:hypothetical protein
MKQSGFKNIPEQSLFLNKDITGFAILYFSKNQNLLL